MLLQKGGGGFFGEKQEELLPRHCYLELLQQYLDAFAAHVAKNQG